MVQSGLHFFLPAAWVSPRQVTVALEQVEPSGDGLPADPDGRYAGGGALGNRVKRAKGSPLEERALFTAFEVICGAEDGLGGLLSWTLARATR